MSTTIITNPQEISPAYNEAFCIADSTNKNKDGFRYIAEILVNDVIVKTDRITPDPSNAMRGLVHLAKFAQSYLTLYNKIDLTAPIVIGTLNRGYINLKVRFGEEYFGTAWAYNGFGFAGAVNWTNFSNAAINPQGLSRTMLFTSTGGLEPPYSVGDYINITQTDPLNTAISGTHIVLDKEQISTGGIEWILVLGLTWQVYQTPSTFAGSTSYADGRKVTTLNKVETAEFKLFNGSVPFEIFEDWTDSDYLTDASNKKFLTTMPRDGYKIRSGSKAFLHFWDKQSEATREIVFEYTGGTNKFIFGGVDKLMYLTDAMPSRISASPLPSEYNVFIEEDGSAQRSEKIKFILDNRCYEFEKVEILFLDRLGSVMPFYFNLKHTETDKNKKDFYTKDVESNLMYRYDLQDGGQVAYNIDLETTFTLRTDALTVDEARYLGELVSSGWTVVKFGDGDYLRCNVITTSYEYKGMFEGELRYYEIQIRMANETKVNW